MAAYITSKLRGSFVYKRKESEEEEEGEAWTGKAKAKAKAKAKSKFAVGPVYPLKRGEPVERGSGGDGSAVAFCEVVGISGPLLYMILIGQQSYKVRVYGIRTTTPSQSEDNPEARPQ
eukprot:scaffold258_cov115-Pinguiococcus_pyrenoidosus.AAC.1